MSEATLELRSLGLRQEAPSETAYRSWEELYRRQWTWDRVAKGTCNRADCIAACSLDLYVKDGIVWREEQNAIYDQTNASVPDFNPRGCQKGACYSDLMYDATRIKYPLRRVGERGSGRWERVSWEEALEQIADKIMQVVEEDGPETVVYDFGTTNIDFGPGTPAEILLTRLMGVTALDEWAGVGDLPMGAIQTWGLFNADGTSDDWFNSDTILVWLGNPVYTRVPDVHFMWEARYRGAQVVTIAPDYNATAVHSDLWLNPRVGTDAALALAMCQVIVDEGLLKEAYVQEQTDLPFLVREGSRRFLRQSDLEPEGKDDVFYVWDRRTNSLREAPGSAGKPEPSIALGDLDPALEGRFEITTLDGTRVSVRPVFELLRERLGDHTPEKASAITGVSASVIRRLARRVAASRAVMVFASWGACKHYHMDLVQRAIILLLALTGNTGKRGAGLRIGAWWNMTLSYDAAAAAAFLSAAGDQQRPPVREIENLMKTVVRAQGSTVPVMVWLYAHDEGYRRIVDDPKNQDPTLPRPVPEYVREALDKGWMPLYPPEGKQPRVFLYSGMNPLRRWPVPDVIRENLWSKLELIVTWEFRMSTSAMYSDIILPAAGWHEKAGVKFSQSYLPYIVVAEKAVEPLWESKNEFDIMARLAATIERRAREREMPPFNDAFGNEHDFTALHKQWSLDGQFVEGDAEKALNVSLGLSPPTKCSLEEATSRGIVRVKSAGSYGPITAITSDIRQDETVYPFAWFVEGKEAWPTITGRQQFYLDHAWFLEMGEELPLFKEEPKSGGDYPLRMTGGHTRWSIHAIWRANSTLLRLQRGEPVMYVSQEDARRHGLGDHDVAWVHNDVGGFKVRVKIAPGVQPGQVVMYHAWEPYQFDSWAGQQAVNPSAWKPLHLVGDYGQLRYRFALAQPSHISRAFCVDLSKAV